MYVLGASASIFFKNIKTSLAPHQTSGRAIWHSGEGFMYLLPYYVYLFTTLRWSRIRTFGKYEKVQNRILEARKKTAYSLNFKSSKKSL